MKHLLDQLDQLLPSASLIERLLLVEVAAFVLLLAVLRLYRALFARKTPVSLALMPTAEMPSSPPLPDEQIAASASPLPLQASAPSPVATEALAAPIILPVEAVRPSARPVPRHRREADEAGLTPDVILSHARAAMATGATEEAAAQLRQCIRLAAKSSQPAIEASARLELGDLARASGDLTTACEHWQMARVLFTQVQNTHERVATEQRMEHAGCPTDWVLTQF